VPEPPGPIRRVAPAIVGVPEPPGPIRRVAPAIVGVPEPPEPPAMLEMQAALARLADRVPGPVPLMPLFALQGRDRATEEAEREYERGTRALDRRQWDEAVAHFNEVANLGKAKADGALYWKAYALAKLGRSSEALSTLQSLSASHPQSRWLNDAKALGVEISQAAGKPPSPEGESDNDVKLMAINGLMNSDPERAIPLLEKLLQNQSSPKLRERALFVLSQTDSPKAREIVTRAAKGEFNPDLQLKAVQSLGVYGGKQNRQLLTEIYSSSSDPAIKRQILRSYLAAGEREPLLAAAKSEQSPELRMQAIQLLGAMGATSQLADLYASESSVDVRSRILQSLHASGNSQKLIEVAKSENDPKLRARAIQLLGTMNSPQAAEALTAIYTGTSDTEVRASVLRSLFTSGNAKQLVEIARRETNPDLKKAAVSHLTHMKSREATDYLMELLK
jgi:HEAT repeat protein